MWMLPLFNLHKQLSYEYDLEDTKVVYSWGEAKRNKYFKEIRTWLISTIEEDDAIITLSTGEGLQVVREVPRGSEEMYLTVKYKDGLVYSIKE